MKFVGPHVSTAGGVENAPLNASKLGAKAFGLFTKNQRQWVAPALSEESIAAFKKNMADCGYKPAHVLPHDSYLINVGNPDPDAYTKSLNALVDELQRVEALGLTMLNFHPGGHLNKSTDEECIERIAGAMNVVISKTKSAKLVIESTAGQGSHLGYLFEHLAGLIERVENRKRVGVCLDTCHMFGAGYDIRTPKTYEATMEAFGKIVGFKYLSGIHLNDAKVELGSRVDRHHSIGKGTLGLKTFRMIMNDPRLDDIPIILETIDDTIWEEEIRMLYKMVSKAPREKTR